MFFHDRIIFEYSSDHTCLELQNLICHIISYKIHKKFWVIHTCQFYFLNISNLD